MRLSLTHEQVLIQDSVESLLSDEYDFAKRKRSLDAPHGCLAQLWQQFAQMGWLGLPIAAERGGLGAGAVETGLLMRAFGRHLVVEPFHACVLQAGRVLAALGSSAQCQAWLEPMMQGQVRLALACAWPMGDTGAPAAIRAVSREGQWELSGQLELVAGAAGAHAMLIAAVCGPSAQQRVFLLPAATPGLECVPALRADGSHAADIRLHAVLAQPHCLLGGDTDATPVLEAVLAQAQIALCWEAVGAMRAAYEHTVAYTSQRQQFGQALSKFQVVAHLLAEMVVCCEEAQAACDLAALRVDRGDGYVVHLASMAKSKVAREARFVAHNAVQLHGAMGVTQELAVAAWFRKLTSFCQEGGSAAWHSRQLGLAMLDSDAWRTSQSLPA